MKENDFLIFITVIAIALADVLTDDEINVLSASLTQLSVSLSTISTNRSFNTNTTDVTTDQNNANVAENVAENSS